MRYLSVCSGIEAATVAWHPLGWEPVAFAEIDPFACAVLRHHYPGVPNRGDFTAIESESADLLVGGTPCQDFSVAGLRAGLAGARGNLTLQFLALAGRARPRWLVWENVPGVLSVDDGRAFGAFLGGLAELGYGWAYRVLDAQHFGVPQRRRRVFVVGHLGDWRRAAAVLFERHSLSGHPPPRREAREGVTPVLAAGAHGSNGAGVGLAGDPAFTLDTTGVAAVAQTLKANSGRNHVEQDYLAVAGGQPARYGKGPDSDVTDALVAHSLRADGFDAGEDGTGRGTPLVPVTSFDSTWSSDFGFQEDVSVPIKDGHGTVPAVAFSVKHSNQGIEEGDLCPTLGVEAQQAVAFSSKDTGQDAGEVAPTLRAMPHDRSHANGGGQVAVAFHEDQRTGAVYENGHTHALAAQGGGKPGQGYQAVREGMAVRRLTPVECERLQGFPDDYTLVPYRGKPAADGPRYRALGNSFAVPVVAWLGRRIQMVEEVTRGVS